MRTDSDVINYIYSIINVSGVTSIIDGIIYKGIKKINSELQDIVILSLPVNNNDTQSATVIINAFCVDFIETGTQNRAKLTSIANAIITALESYVKTAGVYFQYDIISQNIIKSEEQENMSYVSIRLNCWIENDSEV